LEVAASSKKCPQSCTSVCAYSVSYTCVRLMYVWFYACPAQVNQIGGSAVVAAWPWHKYDVVIDIAGGVGGFMADILKANPKLQGIVLDQPQQIDRAHKVSGGHLRLLPWTFRQPS